MRWVQAWARSRFPHSPTGCNRQEDIMSFTASARRVGATLRHEVDVNGRHTIITDEPASVGGTDEGPAPHELLAATLASCVSTMLALYAQNRGWELSDLSVDVVYDNESAPRRFEVILNLPAGLTAGQLQRLTRVADTCPVRRALEAGFEFSEQVSTSRDPLIAQTA
jgi:putative redox protein